MADVYIAEGHGRRPDGTFDPGAVDGVHSEQRDSKPVAAACTQVLRNAGLAVVSESDMADDPNFYGTTANANAAGVKCVVSFHYDWNQAPPGAFAIATSDDGRQLGWKIEAKVAEAGFVIRDYPDDRDNLYLLNNTLMPAVIFECGRIGHEDIDETHEQEAMGKAAAFGILDWLQIPQPLEEDVMTPAQEAKLNAVLEKLDAIPEASADEVWATAWDEAGIGAEPTPDEISMKQALVRGYKLGRATNKTVNLTRVQVAVLVAAGAAAGATAPEIVAEIGRLLSGGG